MEIELFKKPKNPTIIEGFPGFGLVANITTEYLIDHLKAELIGTIKVTEIQPIVAIHDQKVVHPVGIFYDKGNNIVIVHVITNSSGIEWDLTNIILKLAKDLDAKQIISIEGVVSANENDEETGVYFYSDNGAVKSRFEKAKIKPLREGIVVGVTGALLLEKDAPVGCVFAETHSEMPDSKAAAKVIGVLDKVLGLNIDYGPLLRQAEVFEQKLKKLIEQNRVMASEQERKKMSYIT